MSLSRASRRLPATRSPRMPRGMRRFVGLLLVLAGAGLMLSGLSAVLHH